MVTVFSASLASCGDDEKEKGGESKSVIVGTWVFEYEDDGDSYYSIMDFKADGTGVAKVYLVEGSNKTLEENETFRWAFDEENMKITIEYAPDDIETYDVVVLTNDLILIDGSKLVRQ